MKPVPLICALPGGNTLAATIAARCHGEPTEPLLHRFPDQECGVRIVADPRDRDVVVVAPLDDPDRRMATLQFTVATLREHGARRIVLVAPYLPYMRQDREFEPGVGTLARHYAHWLSQLADVLLTVDPHLHRIHRLDEIFSSRARLVAAAPAIAAWIAAECNEPPLLVGPDGESAQWVNDIARRLHCPAVHLRKTRLGDAEVQAQSRDLRRYRGRQAIVVDDIVSTAATMIETVTHLRQQDFEAPLCIAVHGLFCDNAYTRLLQAGAARIVSCNTVSHLSNGIDVHGALADAVADELGGGRAPTAPSRIARAAP